MEFSLNAFAEFVCFRSVRPSFSFQVLFQFSYTASRLIHCVLLVWLPGQGKQVHCSTWCLFIFLKWLEMMFLDRKYVHKRDSEQQTKRFKWFLFEEKQKITQKWAFCITVHSGFTYCVHRTKLRLKTETEPEVYNIHREYRATMAEEKIT